MSAETTPAIERGAAAADRAVMGYTRPDGTYVQGAVNFWDDSVDDGALIARDVLAAALDVEEMAWAMCTSAQCSGSKRTCPNYSVNVELATKVRTALLGTTL
jgi:hypothetical protein